MGTAQTDGYIAPSGSCNIQIRIMRPGPYMKYIKLHAIRGESRAYGGLDMQHCLCVKVK